MKSTLGFKILVFLLVAVFVPACSNTLPSQSPQSGSSLNLLLTHNGRWITNPYGQVVIFHAVNIVEKTPPYYPSYFGFSQADAKWLKENGFLAVRLGVLATGIMPAKGKISVDYINNIFRTVKMLRSYGIYVLIDMHQDGWGPSIGSDGFPSWMTITNGAINNHAQFPLYYVENPAIQNAFQSFFNNQGVKGGKAIQSYYAQTFYALAKAFKNEPNVIGYDLFNEPWPGLSFTTCLSSQGCASLETRELGPPYSKADKAIRQAGDHHLIFGEPFVLFNFGQSPTYMAPPGGDPNSGMSFHMYTLLPQNEPKLINYALDWSKRTSGTLLNTEWGATTDPISIARQSKELDDAMIPWIFWSYVSELASSFASPFTASNIIASTAQNLIQPYAYEISGIPLTNSYSPSSKELSFSWSSKGVTGKIFPTGSITTFVIPRGLYPNGYRLILNGVAVLRNSGNPLVELKSLPGFSKYSVKVLPA